MSDSEEEHSTPAPEMQQALNEVQAVIACLEAMNPEDLFPQEREERQTMLAQARIMEQRYQLLIMVEQQLGPTQHGLSRLREIVHQGGEASC